MYVDILRGRERPVKGWYLQAMGRREARNSCYLVLSSYLAKRRDPKAAPRVMMTVELVEEIPARAKVFEFYWYPRKKKRKRTFEEYIRRGVS